MTTRCGAAGAAASGTLAIRGRIDLHTGGETAKYVRVTKGGMRAIADIDLFRPERDAFACTLTTLDDDFSMKWERGAALPGGAGAIFVAAGSCTNCHSQVHGSNHPAGAKLMR